MTDSTNVQKAEYLLKTMLFDPSTAAHLGVYTWASESSRWNALVSIVISHVCDLPDEDLRDITKYLSDLNHLDISQLAQIRITGDSIDRSDEQATKIIDIFRRMGVSEPHALRILLLLCQIASGLNSERFGGKVQRYFRSYGETILNDIHNLFSLNGSDNEMRRIFVLWLQKVLNMPVLIQDAVVTEFCEKHGISVDDLLEAADNINLNVAIVDDLLQLESARER